MTSKVLADSTARARIEAAADTIDLGAWLFSLPEDEYQQCAPGDHIAAGATLAADGRPMSINVEQVGTSLIVQHYVGETVGAHRCELVSPSSDVFSFKPQGRTTVHVTWELSVTPESEDTSVFENHVLVTATEEFEQFLEENSIPFEQAAAARQTAVTRHNELETPGFAASIGRTARKAAREAN